MILLISTCKEKLHELEFVVPIEKIIEKDYFVKHYLDINEKDLKIAKKIIICGTSLKDNEFLRHMNKFKWLKEIKKPVLGICAGSHILQLIFGGKKMEIKEIGQIFVKFEKKFLGLSGVQKVYFLHQMFIKNNKFTIFGSSTKCACAFKHKEKDLYGVLFHPEVFNKNIIKEFIKL